MTRPAPAPGRPLAAVPTLDALAQDPTLAAGLPPAVARDLLVRLGTVQPLLLLRALAGGGPPADAGTAPVEYLTADRVAELLQIPKQHVYELIRRGELSSIRLGKYVRVPASALTAKGA